MSSLCDFLRAARHHDAAGLDHEGLLRELERELCVLLDHQDGHLVLAVDLAEDTEQVADHQRREAERRLVQQHQPRP